MEHRVLQKVPDVAGRAGKGSEEKIVKYTKGRGRYFHLTVEEILSEV